MRRDKREYGLNAEDREWIIKNNFIAISHDDIKEILSTSTNQSDKVLGAILFLTRSDNLSDLQSCVQLANEDEHKLLNAATVKDERS